MVIRNLDKSLAKIAKSSGDKKDIVTPAYTPFFQDIFLSKERISFQVGRESGIISTDRYRWISMSLDKETSVQTYTS